MDHAKLKTLSKIAANKVLKKKSASMQSKIRVNIGSRYNQLEKEVIDYIEHLKSKNKRSTRLIFLNKVLDLDKLFKGGIGSTGLMSKIIKWLCYGLKIRFNLCYKRISGASKNMPVVWEAKAEQIVTHVASLQVEKLM